MKVFFDLLSEYILITRLHLSAPFKKIPTKWKEGSKTDVIYIQGFRETWNFAEFIGDELNSRGHRIHMIRDFEKNTRTIQQSAEILNEYIARNKISNPLLIGHSRGGLIGKYYLDYLVGKDNDIRLVSIATPYGGSLVAHLSFMNLYEMIPNSKVLKKILSNKNNHHKIVNIHAKIDNHIWPNRNAVLPGGTNVEINIIGHTRILRSKETLGVVINNLISGI